MNYRVEQTELINIFVAGFEIGYKKAVQDVGIIKPFLKLREAYKAYDESTVKRWIEEGLITPQKDGPKNSMVRLDRIRLEILAHSSNRSTYLSTEERRL